MFAVPGWSISASSLASDKERHPRKSGKQDTENKARNEVSPKKRKHDHVPSQKSSSIADEDLDSLWKRYVRGEGDAEQVDGSEPGFKLVKKERKRQKLAASPITDNAGHPGPRSREEASSQARKQKDKKFHKQDKEQRTNGRTSGVREQRSPPRPENLSTRPTKAKKSDKREKVLQNPTSSQPKASSSSISLPTPPLPASSLTPLQQSMRQKLLSARFRHLNQTLYTTPSSSALALFTESPNLFAEYHAGFSQQVQQSWPENPVDGYIHTIRIRGKARPPQKQNKERHRKPGGARDAPVDPLPRRPTGSCTIIDLGCGDAALSRALQPSLKPLGLQILSYDLHAPNDLVTKADIAALPLRDGEADVAIFCLSLMGTNWIAFVEEAWRVLRGDGKGEVWVSEVKSRFGRVGKKSAGGIGQQKKKPKPKAKSKKLNQDGDEKDEEEALGEEIFAEDEAADPASAQQHDETDIGAFVDVFQRRGFVLRPDSVEKSNKMFVRMVFVKAGVPCKGKWAGKRWTGKDKEGFKPHQQQQYGQKRFIERDRDHDDVTLEEETKVLKPCVYKLR